MRERVFLIFLLFFSEFSCPGRLWTEFGTKFFFSFSAHLIPFWLKIMLERGFSIFFFNFIAIFFGNFHARVEYERKSGLKFFSLFLDLYHPFLANYNAGKRFLNFFLLFFSEFSCPGRVCAKFGTKIFFFSFSAYLISFWIKIMPKRGF